MKSLFLFMCSIFVQNLLWSQTDPIAKENPFFRYIRINASRVITPYGFIHTEIKDSKFPYELGVEINVYKGNSFYASGVIQPMTSLVESETLDLIFASPSYFYDAFVRSRAYQMGYVYTRPIKSWLDVQVKLGIGQTFLEIREVLTNKDDLNQSHFDQESTILNFSVGISATASLRNNLGIHLATNASLYYPLLNAGISYTIPSKP